MRVNGSRSMMPTKYLLLLTINDDTSITKISETDSQNKSLCVCACVPLHVYVCDSNERQ